MKIKGNLKSSVSLESVAMTDIIMNMFIFFFVTFTLLYTFNPQRESRIKINLPQGQTTVKARGEMPVIVTVNAKNEVYIGGNLIPLQGLVRELTLHAQTAKQNGLIIKSDRQASVNYFVKVLDAAKQAGIDKLGVAIELQERVK